MIFLIATTWIFTLCGLCQAQDFRNGKIIGVSEDRTCAPLVNPAHGEYVCHSNEGQEICELRCHSGYLVPITFSPLDRQMEVKERGRYVCKQVIGGVTWWPPILFDCVEKRLPEYLLVHYGINFNFPCNTTTDLKTIQQDLRSRLPQSKVIGLCNHKKVECRLNITLECDGGSLMGDLVVSVKCVESITSVFDLMQHHMDRKVDKDSKNILKLTGQTSTIQVSKGSFFTDCPNGTLIESDLTCRGCSKGYFLDLSRAVCAPCPVGTYQDQNLQAHCKRCPKGSRQVEGLMDQKSCFSSGGWQESTSIKTLISALFWIVLVGNIVIYYRGTVTYEVTPHTKEKDILDSVSDLGSRDSYLDAQIGSCKASGDSSLPTNQPLVKVQEVIEMKRKSLVPSGLPMEPLTKTASARKSLARERMRLTMTAHNMRRSAQLRITKATEFALKQRRKTEEDKLKADEMPKDSTGTSPTLRQRQSAGTGRQSGGAKGLSDQRFSGGIRGDSNQRLSGGTKGGSNQRQLADARKVSALKWAEDGKTGPPPGNA